MAFYSDVILPRLLDRSMRMAAFAPYRRATLADVRGDILEIGFGTGLNLPYYPAAIQTITALDVSPGMSKLAQPRIAAASLTVEHHVGDGERLPFESATFDSVVSTFTLCSIGDVGRALREIRRVLRPGGRFHFVEHGLSDDRQIQVWQRRLTPLQKFVAGGCHLDRDMHALITGAGFTIGKLERVQADELPKISGYLYLGQATA